jgi:phage FluMu protein Com
MSSPTKLSIRTQHCRFCNHLLLATTRTLSTLPRRSPPAADSALILPLEKLRTTTDEEPTSTQAPSNPKSSSSAKHVTILLSTTLPDRRATLIRREDGIEKRILLRCGRCRVVVGYYLDRIHWEGTSQAQKEKEKAIGEDSEEEGGDEERPPAMYVLPGSLVETEDMDGEGVGGKEWRVWGGDA